MVNKTVFRKNLRIIWKVWLIITIIAAAPPTFQELTGKTPKIPVMLQPNFQIEWQTWRPFDTSNKHFEMKYQRIADKTLEKELLGEYGSDNQGVPVQIKIQLNDKSCVFSQTAMFSLGIETTRRKLVTDESCTLVEQAGTNHWQLTVMSVGEKLQGVKTDLMTSSPYGGFKIRVPGIYGFIDDMVFWSGLVILPLWALYTFSLIVMSFVYFIRKK